MSEQKQENVDIRNIWTPSKELIGIVFFAMWLVYFGVNERYKIREEHKTEINNYAIIANQQHEKLREDISELQDQISGVLKQHNQIIDQYGHLIEKLRERQVLIIENLWTKKDHDIWCRELQAQNPNVFKCPKKYDGTLEQEGINSSAQQELERMKKESPDKFWIPPDTHHPANSDLLNNGK